MRMRWSFIALQDRWGRYWGEGAVSGPQTLGEATEMSLQPFKSKVVSSANKAHHNTDKFLILNPFRSSKNKLQGQNWFVDIQPGICNFPVSLIVATSFYWWNLNLSPSWNSIVLLVSRLSCCSLMESAVMWLHRPKPPRLLIPRCCEWDIYCTPYFCAAESCDGLMLLCSQSIFNMLGIHNIVQ